MRGFALLLVAFAATALLAACGSSSRPTVVTTTVYASSYQQVFLKVGHTRTYDYLHRGDQIFCLRGKQSVEAGVPSRRAAAFKQQALSPTRRLALNVGWRHGDVWALCRIR